MNLWYEWLKEGPPLFGIYHFECVSYQINGDCLQVLELFLGKVVIDSDKLLLDTVLIVADNEANTLEMSDVNL